MSATNSFELGKPEPTPALPPKSGLKRYRLSLIAAAAIVSALALGVGLGLGLHRSSTTDNPSTQTNSTSFTPTSTGSSWQPTVSTTFNYQLSVVPTSGNTHDIPVWFIDLWGANKTVINGLQSNGAKVVCYFSAGSSEDWRPDFSQFQASDLGNDLKGWKGEKWINTKSDTVRTIMKARLDQAVSKQCDGVDPDNMDAYDNEGGGLSLTTSDAIDYTKFLAQEASSRNLAIGLKNAAKILPDVLSLMQWSVNEQCVALKECEGYSAFIKAGKPVFNIEYPKGDDTNNDDAISSDQKDEICNQQVNKNEGFSTILKNMNLNQWIEFCNGTSTVLT